MNDFYSKLRVSFAETQKETWYKPIADHIIDLATTYANDKDKIETQIKAARGKVNVKDIQEELKAYNADPNVPSFPTHINDLEFISGITERYMGEYIRQFTDFEVFNNDPNVVMKRNKELNSFLSDRILEAILDLYKQKQEANSQSQQPQPEVQISEEEIKKLRKEFLDNWVDEKTVEYQNRVKLLDILTDSDLKYIQGFFYWFATEQVYSYRRVVGTNIIKEIINPMEYYRIPGNNNVFVEDDPMGVRVTRVNLNTLNIEHRKDLSETDYTFLVNLLDKGCKDGDYFVTPTMLESRIITRNAIDNLFNGSPEVRFTQNGDITKYHIVFKKEEPIQILTYYGSDGSIKEQEVDMDYQLDIEAGDIDLKTDHILRVMDMYRFGSKEIGIYTKPNYVIPERNNVSNSSIVKLPYNGITGILGDGVCNPVPSRIVPLQVLTKFYTYQQQRSISKYKNYLVMSEDLIEDSEETSRLDKLAIAKQDGLLFINGENANANVLQTLRNINMSGMEQYIATLSQLIAELKRNAMEIASMNEQRYGDINTSAGKATTEYAITKATTASILLFEMFNKFRERDGLADIDASKVAWVNGMQGSYYDKQNKKVVYVDVSGEDHLSSNIGLYFKNGVLENEKKQKLTDLAFSSAQNGQLTLAAEALDADNMSALKQLIKEVEEKNKQMEQANTQYLEENKLRIEQLRKEIEDNRLANDVAINKYSQDMETARLELQLAHASYLQSLASENNDDDIKLRKQELDEKKFALNQLIASNKSAETVAKLAQQSKKNNAKN